MDKRTRTHVVTKLQLIDELSEKTGYGKRAAKSVLDALSGMVTDHLAAGEAVVFCGIGRFMPKTVAAYNCSHPATQQLIRIPEHKSVSYKPSCKLKRALAGQAQPPRKKRTKKSSR